MTKNNIAVVGLRAMGEWNAATTYQPLSVVKYDGCLYIATAQSAGVVPSDGMFWMTATLDGEEFSSISVDENDVYLSGDVTVSPVLFEGNNGFSGEIEVTAQNGGEDVSFSSATFVLGVNAWVGNGSPYSQTVQIEGVTADGINFISAPDNATLSEIAVLYAANFQDGGQKDGEITILCYGDVPSTDVTLKITMFNN